MLGNGRKSILKSGLREEQSKYRGSLFSEWMNLTLSEKAELCLDFALILSLVSLSLAIVVQFCLDIADRM